MLRQHFATMTQTVLLMWLRHAGGCVELGLVTVHSAPSRVITVTAPQSLGTILTRPTRRSAAAAATLPARATQVWLRACEAAARASSAARCARRNAASAICAYVTAPSAARSALRTAAAARVLRFLLRLRLRLRLPWGGRRARSSCVAARGRCGRSGKMHAMPRSVRQHVSVWPAKGSKVVQTVQIRHESSVSPPKRRANQSSSSLAMLADVRGARSRLEPEQAADGARCCDAGGGDDENTHSTCTRQRWRGAQPSICIIHNIHGGGGKLPPSVCHFSYHGLMHRRTALVTAILAAPCSTSRRNDARRQG